MIRVSCFAALLLAGGLGAAVTPAVADHAVQRVNRAAHGWPIDAFTLVDQHGKQFTRDRLLGNWTFALFGDTSCVAECAQALSALAGMMKRIAPTTAVKTTQIVFISLEPERDSAAVLKQYLAQYDERFIGATGSRQTLQRLVEDMGVENRIHSSRAARNGREGEGGSLVLIGPDAFIRAEFLPPFDVLQLTAEYLKTRVRK